MKKLVFIMTMAVLSIVAACVPPRRPPTPPRPPKPPHAMIMVPHAGFNV
ncbi:hypothetical protein [Chitinophaga jiangningensis]|nr:hypothetical protein [Chitinophaga jiangningensis]